MQAALLGRDRQPIPRHTVEYSPFDVVRVIVRVDKLDGTESGIDEAFCARGHAGDAPERDLRDEAPLRCRGLEAFVGDLAGAQERRDMAEHIAAVGMEQKVEVCVMGDTLEDPVCGEPLDGRAERIAGLTEKGSQLAGCGKESAPPGRSYVGS